MHPHSTHTMKATMQPGAPPAPTLAVLEALTLADHLTIPEIRTRVADGWPTGKLGRTLDLLRERGLIARVDTDTYCLSIAGRAALRGGAAHG